MRIFIILFGLMFSSVAFSDATSYSPPSVGTMTENSSGGRVIGQSFAQIYGGAKASNGLSVNSNATKLSNGVALSNGSSHYCGGVAGSPCYILTLGGLLVIVPGGASGPSMGIQNVNIYPWVK